MARRRRDERTKTTHRIGRVTWTIELKQTVYILFQEATYDNAVRLAIFNEIHKEHLTACGLAGGIAFTTLRSQYGMASQKPCHADWGWIRAPPASEEAAVRRRNTLLRVRDVASRLTSSAIPSPSSLGSRRRLFKANQTHMGASPPNDNARTPSSDAIGAPDDPTSARKKRSDGQQTPSKVKHAYTQKCGSTIWMSKSRFDKTKLPIRAVPDFKAHPPRSGLLFRSWCKGDVGAADDHNSEEGFVARRYFGNPIWPTQMPGIDIADVFTHLNRDKRDTPLISTASRLSWIIRKGLKQALEHNKDGDHEANKLVRISVIDPHELEANHIHWAKPYHNSIVHKAEFKMGAQYYDGKYEHWVWRDIPKNAMVRTITLQELGEFFRSTPEVRGVLAYELLGPETTHKALPKKLKELKIPLDFKTTRGIAKMALFLGLTFESSQEHLSYVVSEVVSGWYLDITSRSEEAWLNLAKIFAEAISQGSKLSRDEEQYLWLAFLDGVYWGLGDGNARFTQEGSRCVHSRAARRGLISPARIVANELERRKQGVLAIEQAQAQQLEEYYALLMNEADAETAIDDEQDIAPHLDETQIDDETEDEIAIGL